MECNVQTRGVSKAVRKILIIKNQYRHIANDSRGTDYRNKDCNGIFLLLHTTISGNRILHWYTAYACAYT